MTLEDHCRDWARRQRAPEAVANAYAAYVVAEVEADPGLLPGWHHPRDYPAWASRNLSECMQCGSPWALRQASCWECQDCGCSRPDRGDLR